MLIDMSDMSRTHGATTALRARMLPIRLVAEAVEISEQTARRLCAAGEIPGAVKVGGQWRVSEDDLVHWIESLEDRTRR